MGGAGAGKVDDKKLREYAKNWGTMPDKERQAAIMEITMGGNTCDFCSGAAIVSPPAMLAREAMIAS